MPSSRSVAASGSVRPVAPSRTSLGLLLRVGTPGARGRERRERASDLLALDVRPDDGAKRRRAAAPAAGVGGEAAAVANLDSLGHLLTALQRPSATPAGSGTAGGEAARLPGRLGVGARVLASHPGDTRPSPTVAFSFSWSLRSGWARLPSRFWSCRSLRGSLSRARRRGDGRRSTERATPVDRPCGSGVCQVPV